MSIKSLSRDDWKRVLEYRSKLIKHSEYKNTYIYGIKTIKVKEPFYVHIDKEQVCLLDNNYTWIQILSLDKRGALTMQYNKDGEIIQWYFDITNKHWLEHGIPYYEDMYLDVIVTPDEKVFLLDENEIEEALENKLITKEEYEQAYHDARTILNGIAVDIKKLKKIAKDSYNYLKDFLN